MAKNKAEYMGTGRRKNAIARVRLVPGEGNFMLDGKDDKDYFGQERLSIRIRKPFEVTGTIGKYDVIAKLQGGGINGQAGALTLGIARALVEINEDFRDELKKAGLLTRDQRMKERRKYGLKKARKKPQFSKR